jgi:DNA repair photolyase
VGVITKSHLVTRDVDLLADLARHGAVAVMLSVTTLDRDLQLRLEPRAAIPARRLGAIRVLAEAGIPVGVNVAPVIPGLTDHEVPVILEAAAEAGASFAGMIVLRLPGVVKEIFEGWLRENVPGRADKVLNRVHLDDALSKLPPQLRETLLLFEREGFSIAEIASMMKRSESAIKHRLRTARDQLRIHYFGGAIPEKNSRKEQDLVRDET